MQFLYTQNAKEQYLNIENDDFKYLFKVRRHQVGDFISLKNFDDSSLYRYKVVEINKKSALLLLQESSIVTHNRDYFELAWGVVDTKVIEKTLPFLNEIGVSKISFVYTDRSQKSFELNFERVKSILINSNQQCGRYDFMEFEIFDSLKEFIDSKDDFAYLDFGGACDFSSLNTILVGPEGGFTNLEREILLNKKKVGFNTDSILRSESAVISVASKVLL